MGAVTEQTSSPRPRVSARLSAIAESATLAVDAKAKALKAAGRPVIGFGAGEPDFPTPGYIVDAAIAAAKDPVNHRYSPAAGLPALREAVAAKTLRDSGYEVKPSQVLVTNGGKQAVYQAFAAVVDPGDEVLLPAPYWTTYPEAIRLAGGVPVEVFAGADQGYLVTVEQLEAARTPKTKALLFCSPSNPTGAVYSPEETAAIGRWALEHGIWVITDEIYEHLTYDHAVFTPIVRVVPELADTTIVLNGVAKTYAMTGWRVGWMIGPARRDQGRDQPAVAPDVERGQRVAARGDRRADRRPGRGRGDAVRVRPSATPHRRDAQRDRRLRGPGAAGCVLRLPLGAGGARPHVSAGSRPPRRPSWPTLILEQAEVAVVPGEAFGPSGYLRLSYALGDDDLIEGVSRIQALLRGLAATLSTCAISPPCPRPTSTSTSPGRCASRRWPSSPQSHGLHLPDVLLDDDPLHVPADERGWFRFQRLYDAARACVRTEADMRRIVDEAAADDAAEGSGRLEIQVDPTSYAPFVGGITPALEIVLDAAREASLAHGVDIGVIVAASRMRHPLEARILARLAAHHAGGPGQVVGFGLSNDERRGETAEFAHAFDIARDAGLASVPHGGELLGPAHVEEVARPPAPRPAGARRAVRRGPAGARPGGLVGDRARAVPRVERVARGVPVGGGRAAARAGVAGATVALGADDPLLFRSRLVDQYELARSEHGFTDDELAELARSSIRASRASATVKARLLAGVDGWLAS